MNEPSKLTTNPVSIAFSLVALITAINSVLIGTGYLSAGAGAAITGVIAAINVFLGSFVQSKTTWFDPRNPLIK